MLSVSCQLNIFFKIFIFAYLVFLFSIFKDKSKFIPARLSEVSPDLLGVSSSSDEEEEPNKLKFFLKDSDDDEEPERRSSLRNSSNSKKKSLEKSSNSKSTILPDSEKNLDEDIDEDAADEDEIFPSPSKMSKRVEISSESEQDQPTTSNRTTTTAKEESPIRSPVLKHSQTKRISTPKPKMLASSAKTSANKSVRQSKILAEQKNKNDDAQDEGSSRRSPRKTPKSSAKSVTIRESPLKTPPHLGSTLTQTPNRVLRSKSPSFESDVLNGSAAGASNFPDDVSTSKKAASGRKAKKTPLRSSVRGKGLQMEGPHFFIT